MKRQSIMLLILIIFTCSTTAAPSKTRQFQSPNNAPQLSIAWSDGKGTITRGLAVPVSPTVLATAAHVVSKLPQGAKVDVLIPSVMGIKGEVRHAFVTKLDSRLDMAWLTLEDWSLPISALPIRCKPTVWHKVMMQVPQFSGNTISATQDTYGLITSLTKMPKLTVKANEELALIGARPEDSLRSSRVVISTVPAEQKGNSGGAIIDVESGCVVGVVSMKFPPESMIDRRAWQKAEKKANRHRDIHLNRPMVVIGIPIFDYLR